MTSESMFVGEQLDVLERVVVSPLTGSIVLATALTPGSSVSDGQQVGTVMQLGGVAQVVSGFAGLVGGLLVASGERVRAGQPVMWLVPGIEYIS